MPDERFKTLSKLAHHSWKGRLCAIGAVISVLTVFLASCGSTSSAPSHQQIVDMLRQKVKYVFVIYQENRSFDSYFGTYPGADGLFSQPASQTLGFTQQIKNTDGTTSTLTPFRIGPQQYAADTDDVDHSHPLIVKKMDITNNTPAMDKFALTEEAKYTTPGQNPSLKAKQYGELTMAYEDCSTIPFLWQYAKNFTLYDHIFQTMTGPSTPGNLAIIAAQTGQTQATLHPNEAYPDNGKGAPGVPVLNDDDPFWGSPKDTTSGQPVNPGDFPGYGVQINQTYASLPLSLAGKSASAYTANDKNPSDDLTDVKDDIANLTSSNKAPVPWGWYEEGYDKEPTDMNAGPTDANGTHAAYITHHNGPQYFGYVSNNPDESKNLHGLGDFYAAVQNAQLPSQGGVFYLKGGFQNQLGLTPADPSAAAQKNFIGDDDHPGYSDAQISEATVAEEINTIAKSPYWSQSAIVITYDDSEGDYDHVAPPVVDIGPDGSVITDGPRVPFLLISPYARSGYISHATGDQGSVVKFVDTLFNVTPLANLPDEQQARTMAQSKGLNNYGPDDAQTPNVADLTDAFDPSRLSGASAPISAAQVMIPENIVHTLPQTSGYGCKDIGITPVDIAKGISNPIPADFNPRPRTEPTLP